MGQDGKRARGGIMFGIIADMWRDDWVGKLLAVLLLVLVGMFLLFVCYFFCWAVDSWFQDHQQENGVIVDKTYTPAHVITTVIVTGNTTIPVVNTIPDEWTVVVRGDSGRVAITTVSQEFYNATDKGKKVSITYHSGRISGGMYVDRLKYSQK